jgi:hypothetical protein
LFCSAPGSRDVAPENANAAPGEEVEESRVRELENKAILNPRLFAEETVVKEAGGQSQAGDQAQEGRASVGAGR